MNNFDLAIENVLAKEGGFVNHRHDPGRATNWGISLRYLAKLKDLNEDGFLDGDIDRDGDVDEADVAAMTQEQAVDYYKSGWWDAFGYEHIVESAVAVKIMDMSVNMGGRQAHKLVQRALRSTGVKLVDDGILGPKTFNAINSANPTLLVTALRCTQAGFYYALVMRNLALIKNGVLGADADFSVFLKGWLNRAYE